MSEEVRKFETSKELKEFYEGEELITVKIRRKDVKLLQEIIEERRTVGVIRRKLAFIVSIVAGLTILWNFWPNLKDALRGMLG